VVVEVGGDRDKVNYLRCAVLCAQTDVVSSVLALVFARPVPAHVLSKSIKVVSINKE